MQYNLSIIFLAVLIVPFLPINSAPSSISWRHLLTASSSTNGDIQTTFLSGNGYNLDKINDFAVSVSTQIPTFIHTLLVFFWSIGIFIMFFLLYRSVKQVKALHSSALPLQNEELNALYIECLNEVNSKHTIPIYSTAFLKSPVLAGFLHPRIYLPIHLISDFNAGTISETFSLFDKYSKCFLLVQSPNLVFSKKNTTGTGTCLRQCCITIIERNRIQVIWKYTD